MRQMSIMRQLTLFSAFLIGLIAILGSFTFWRSSQIYARLEHTATQQVPALRHMLLTDMLHDGLRAVVVESLYLVNTKKMESLPDIVIEKDEKIKAIHWNISELSKLSISESLKKRIEDVKPDLDAYTDICSEIVTLAAAGKADEAEAKMEDYNKSFKKLETSLEAVGTEFEKDSDQESAAGSNTLFMIGVLTSIGVTLGLALAIWTLRKLRQNVQDFLNQVSKTSDSVSSVSERLNSANQQFSASATESAASLQETVASLDELSSMVTLNSENAKKASEVSIQSRESAEKGERQIRELSDAMGVIKTSSKKMEEITNVIDEIAFQTNLLALNAAVEAARAGEQGRGFAVVAEAVRALAQRSSSAAKDINSMIKDSIHKIESGGHIVDSSRESLNTIFNSIKEVSELNHQISKASEEQSLGIKQISQAMNQLDSASQSNATSAQEVSSISTEMHTESNHLQHLIKDLSVTFMGSADVIESSEQKTQPHLKLVKSEKQGMVLDLEEAMTKPQIFDSKKRKVSNLNDF